MAVAERGLTKETVQEAVEEGEAMLEIAGKRGLLVHAELRVHHQLLTVCRSFLAARTLL